MNPDPRWPPESWNAGLPMRSESVGVERTKRERGFVERIVTIAKDVWALAREVWDESRWT